MVLRLIFIQEKLMILNSCLKFFILYENQENSEIEIIKKIYIESIDSKYRNEKFFKQLRKKKDFLISIWE